MARYARVALKGSSSICSFSWAVLFGLQWAMIAFVQAYLEETCAVAMLDQLTLRYQIAELSLNPNRQTRSI